MASPLLVAAVLIGIICTPTIDAHGQGQGHGQGNQCQQALGMCMLGVVMNYYGMSPTEIRQKLRDTELAETCRPFLTAKQCATAVLETNLCNNMPAQVRQGVQLVSKTVDFMCVQEVEVLNENRQCMFGEELNTATESQCGLGGSGQVCRLTEDMECSVNLVRQMCSAEIAQKLGDFAHHLETEFGCHNVIDFTELKKYAKWLR